MFLQRLSPPSRPLARALLCAALVAPTALLAAERPAQQQYNRDRATCLAGESGQDRDTCLREAAAAYQEARQAATSTPAPAPAEPPDYRRNALARCELHTRPADRQSCLQRMQAPAQGSVRGGGLLREATETVQP